MSNKPYEKAGLHRLNLSVGDFVVPWPVVIAGVALCINAGALWAGYNFLSATVAGNRESIRQHRTAINQQRTDLSVLQEWKRTHERQMRR